MKSKRKNLAFLLFLLLAFAFGDCREKIDFATDSSSDNIDIPVQSLNIMVLSPKAGDRFTLGKALIVRWQVSATVQSLGIQLFRKENLISTIASSEVNDGIFLWVIPADLPVSNNYKIKIINKSDPNDYSYSDMFSIIDAN